jgi:glutathione S-transferase
MTEDFMTPDGMTPDGTTPNGMAPDGITHDGAIHDDTTRESEASATIIPFPSRPAPIANPAANPAANPDPDANAAAKARLERALRALDSALGEQRAAVAAWRDTLCDLSHAMQGLGTSMLHYRDSVDSLDGGVAQLRARTAGLAARADAMAAAAIPPTGQVTGG